MVEKASINWPSTRKPNNNKSNKRNKERKK
jgi:hypothetical protein